MRWPYQDKRAPLKLEQSGAGYDLRIGHRGIVGISNWNDPGKHAAGDWSTTTIAIVRHGCAYSTSAAWVIYRVSEARFGRVIDWA
jgi:hypothetical protein